MKITCIATYKKHHAQRGHNV